MARQRKWSELSSTQKRLTIGGGALQMVLPFAALRALPRRPPEQVNGSKRLWTALSFVNILGPAAYFLFGRKRG